MKKNILLFFCWFVSAFGGGIEAIKPLLTNSCNIVKNNFRLTAWCLLRSWFKQDPLHTWILKSIKWADRIRIMNLILNFVWVLSSKQFTGFIVLQLLSKEKLSLNDCLAKYIMAFNHDGKQKITIRNLLTHTSGFGADYTTLTNSLMTGVLQPGQCCKKWLSCYSAFSSLPSFNPCLLQQ